jgi:Uncharacterized protein conserved in bacteria
VAWAAACLLLAVIPARAQTMQPDVAPDAPPVMLSPAVVPPIHPPAPAEPEGSSPPIDIESSDGIEWDRTKQQIIARGNARAVRADLTVTGDVLTAFYRENADGSAEVYRLDGAGRVKITTPSQTATSDYATYDMTSTQLTLTRDKTGARLKVVTGDGEITADDQIDYNRTSRLLIARGRAVATQPGQTLKGDVITATLTEGGGKGRSQFQRVDADGNVDALTPDERIIADKGKYFGDTDTAVFTGAVKIFRGESVLDGCRAEFDLATGFSKLLPCENATGKKARVRGVIVPSAKDG